eukprot:CAMPEP_0118928550 /NCGR_PEP_ID=MMETSP1169-20130426/5780_1 /TAXON_ID=36882 /ORGANISM="Pyramimonas obovata, Strain CCMP722" /LENGTH=243 /DNA_ID=CAMNT_0006870557 /DNA_START=21 /DNA_END=752 /DNA_ORIENTATION=-
MAEVQLNSQAVLGKLASLHKQQEGLKRCIQDSYAHYCEVAVALERQETPEKVNRVREALKDMCAMEAKLQDRCGALTRLPESYICTSEVTDFEGKLQAPPRNLDINQNEMVKKFEREVWNVHHEGEPMPGEEDAEMLVIGSNTGDYRNTKCPLTGLDLPDIEDPVQDREKIIYERKAIENYIRQKGGQAKCPHMGTVHSVRRDDLQPCTNLLRERKRRQLAASQGMQANKRAKSEDVLDLNDD